MRNKELMIKKVEKIERIFTQLEMMVKRQEPVKDFIKVLETGNELTEQVQSLLELEQ